MTQKTLDWLNQNRFRTYPFINNEGCIAKDRRVPTSVLLDCLVVDSQNYTPQNIPSLKFNRYKVTKEQTDIFFTYGESEYSITLTGGEISGNNSITRYYGSDFLNTDQESLYISLTFSSHAYILASEGEGEWSFSGKVLPSKIITSYISGVKGISTQGSHDVDGRDLPGVATKDIHLVDGYRTQPEIKNNSITIKVGNNYGIDPCHHPRSEEESGPDCSNLLFFFCGQNAITSGDLIFSGGPGVIVTQGRKYTAKQDILDTYGEIGIRKGEEIPCIEVRAAPELLRIYRPSSENIE